MIGDPGSAPFGRYAKQAMQNSQIWTDVKKKIKTKKHITLLADTLVHSDSATVGILFSTNVNSDKLKIIYTIDKRLHSPIRYYLAPLKDSLKPLQVDKFLKFLQGSIADKIFRDAGFMLQGT